MKIIRFNSTAGGYSILFKEHPSSLALVLPSEVSSYSAAQAA